MQIGIARFNMTFVHQSKNPNLFSRHYILQYIPNFITSFKFVNLITIVNGLH